MSAQRFEEAYLKNALLDVCSNMCPELALSMNLRVALDDRLDAVHDPMWHHLNEEFFKHAATSEASSLCGRFLMIDGNAKVFRSHCRHKAESEHVVPLVPLCNSSVDVNTLSGGFLYSPRKYCSETPIRKEGGLCALHVQERQKKSTEVVAECSSRLRRTDEEDMSSLASSSSSDVSDTHVMSEGDNKQSSSDGMEEEPLSVELPQRHTLSTATTSAASTAALPDNSNIRNVRFHTRSVSAFISNHATGAELIDPERILSCKVINNALFFLVSWKGKSVGSSTWVPEQSNIFNAGQYGSALLTAFKSSLVPKAFYDNLDIDEELLKLPVDDTPEADIDPGLIAKLRRPHNGKPHKGFKDCAARNGLNNAERTFGGMYAMCPCGFMAGPWEIVGAESCTVVRLRVLINF
ncbi:hypothetical protein CEUSTIGMA_g13922.t1 [Chlamydomonas eustigma]|uniref:Chromo domain-containing protein n=1 Tax=Chlamydomonas eustigma TaxID=1157962 RepID=A0A250XTX4_9CHLO|nr:hypothetical protein CEUSTIGMA_g13922.t1 [Chlamydomonas eustigma]|eukprot:GAX86515.1 hypothetical protein CEUSTIGMA_g13922.t1 [Chlamydomonas eustigma]